MTPAEYGNPLPGHIPAGPVHSAGCSCGGIHLAFGEGLSHQCTQVYWDKAWLSLGITDLETIAEATPVQWNGTELAGYKPGADAGGLLGLGFHAPLPMKQQDAGQKRTFSLRLKVRGSGGIYFTPVGENTTIAVNSAWPTPSFQGNLLPVERSISGERYAGFCL